MQEGKREASDSFPCFEGKEMPETVVELSCIGIALDIYYYTVVYCAMNN